MRDLSRSKSINLSIPGPSDTIATKMGFLSKSSGCPPPPDNANVKGDPLVGSVTFQNLITFIGWGCLGVSILLWLGLIFSHLRRYTVPIEQRQIIRRLVSIPVVYTIVAVISVHAYSAEGYVEPVTGLYETYRLAFLFLLYVQYVAPDAATRDLFFQSLEMKDKKGNVKPHGELQWFRVSGTCYLSLIVG